jgi:hypothetical protein
VITKELGDLGDCLLLFAVGVELGVFFEFIKMAALDAPFVCPEVLVMMMEDDVAVGEAVRGKLTGESGASVEVFVGALTEDESLPFEGVEVIVMLLMVTTDVFGRQLSKMELMLNAIELFDCFG